MLFPTTRPRCFPLAITSAIALLYQPGTLQAAGYGINENSASYMATGFAGRASNPVDASIAANNPAGISFVDGMMISAGAAVIMEGGEFEGKHTAPQNRVIAEGKTKDFQKTTPVPFGHFVMPVNDKLSFGLSGYGPFGIELDYENNWAGRYFGDKTSVKVINLQGTLSYKFRENFSIGVGLIGSYVEGELTQLTSLANSPGTLDRNGKIKGDDKVLAWNIGAVWRVAPVTYLGLAYHSQLDFTLEGILTLRGCRKRMPSSISPCQKELR